MITVACVLKSGGDYHPRHVSLLAAQIRAHLTLKHKFVCLTDVPDVVRRPWIEPIQLNDNWPGWWSKISLFAPGALKPPIIYFDLDVLVVRCIDDIVYDHKFTMLRSFWPNVPVNSSSMAWSIDMSQIYKRFAANPIAFAALYRAKGRWGDQDWILHHAPIKPERWQDRAPGRFFSYKLQVKEDRIPDGASVIVYHGQPRPWDTALGQSVHAAYK